MPSRLLRAVLSFDPALVRRVAATVTACILMLPAAARAQHAYTETTGAPTRTYDPRVPTPRSILGYDNGDRSRHSA